LLFSLQRSNVGLLFSQFLAPVASAGTLQLIFAAPAALAMTLALAVPVNPVSPFPWHEIPHSMFPLEIHYKSCPLLAAAGYLAVLSRRPSLLLPVHFNFSRLAK